MFTFRVNSSVAKEDLNFLGIFMNWHQQARGFFLGEEGKEHYKLLSFLTKQLPPNSKAIDIGTYRGCSALALANAPNVKVITYDIENHIPDNVLSCRQHTQIECRLANCLEEPHLSEILKCHLIFLDIDPHNGKDEKNIVEIFHKNGFEGVLVLDDINLNPEMRNFWENDIPPGTKKVDLTKYGHWSGTGAVIFNPQKYEILLD
jgi:predicted O-methyltransferase YrrM